MCLTTDLFGEQTPANVAFMCLLRKGAYYSFPSDLLAIEVTFRGIRLAPLGCRAGEIGVRRFFNGPGRERGVSMIIRSRPSIS